jgi:hypothetical protein
MPNSAADKRGLMNHGQTKSFKGSVSLIGHLLPTIEEPGRFTSRLDLFRLRSRIEGRIILDPIAIVALTQATEAVTYIRAVFNYTEVHLVDMNMD